MNIHIVPMTAAYLPQAAALEKICFPADPWSEALFQEALENPRVSVLLAQGEEKVTVNGGSIGPLTQRLYDTLTGIQWGTQPDPYGWVEPVE